MNVDQAAGRTTENSVDLSSCEREPIHIPGSIQSRAAATTYTR